MQIKPFLLKMVDNIGINSFSRRYNKNSKNIVVLMYHGVSKSCWPIGNDWLQVREGDFSDQMCYLSNNFDVVRLNSLLKELEKPHRKPLAVVTFDDGYRNNLTVAAPILEYYKIPATIFLVTSRLDSTDEDFYWWDLLRLHLLKFSFTESEIENKRSEIKKLKPDEINSTVNNLINGSLTFKDWMVQAYGSIKRSDLLNCSKLIDYGSHTHNHEILTHLNPDKIDDTLSTSYNIVSTITGTRKVALCYPNGNYNQSIIEVAEELGYDLAVTTEPKLYNYNHCVYSIPRIGIGRNLGLNKFKYLVSGTFQLVHRL